MSCLQALDHLKIDHLIIGEIISKLTSLKTSGFDIHLCWLPGHVGIRGTERTLLEKNNLLFDSIRETEDEDCLKIVSDLITNILKLPVDARDFDKTL